MKSYRSIIFNGLIGILLIAGICLDINFNWYMRGRLAFGGESLLYLVIIGLFVYKLVKEYRHE